jgi:hypothetical protein
MVMATRLADNEEGKSKGGAARAMVTEMRVVGSKEGNGDLGKRDGDGNKGGRQATATATKRVIVTGTRVAGWWRDDGAVEDDGCGSGNDGGSGNDNNSGCGCGGNDDNGGNACGNGNSGRDRQQSTQRGSGGNCGGRSYSDNDNDNDGGSGGCDDNNDSGDDSSLKAAPLVLSIGWALSSSSAPRHLLPLLLPPSNPSVTHRIQPAHHHWLIVIFKARPLSSHCLVSPPVPSM